MASTVCFGINIQNESEITQAICHKKTLPIELVNKIYKQAKRYCFLQNCYESYMTFCSVYEEVQTSLIKKIECDAVRNQILWNAVILVQCLWFIENGERFSPKDDKVLGNSNNGSNHFLGFTGFGVDDFQSADNRMTSVIKWFEQKWLTKDASMIFSNVEVISWLMNECYNDLRKKIPWLSIERQMVMFQSSKSNQEIACSTNIFTPLYHLSPEHKTMPLWVDKSVRKLFLENDCDFNKRDLSKSINERPNDSEKNLYAAIEKMKTDGKLNYETVTTKAVMTKTQMEHEKKSK
jgi:hypothetical protein